MKLTKFTLPLGPTAIVAAAVSASIVAIGFSYRRWRNFGPFEDGLISRLEIEMNNNTSGKEWQKAGLIPK